MNILQAMNNVSKDIEDVNSIADQLYIQSFEMFFRDMRKFYSKVTYSTESSRPPISDSELEWALTELPLQLFSVSEQLSKFKLSQEEIKLRVKELEYLSKQAKADNPEIDEDKLIQSIYSSVISRVEAEISFSREFIMVMKKLWDSRRATDNVNPVTEVAPDLPEYSVDSTKKSKTYIQ